MTKERLQDWDDKDSGNGFQLHSTFGAWLLPNFPYPGWYKKRSYDLFTAFNTHEAATAMIRYRMVQGHSDSL
ncbi:hypothetical protein O0I10_011432 [Lichtheimia ornata]|uniref:Uncharacterized protein n=1 Tax=Lichtheimia ornata TaxID=688661 RepID=A0AAD7XU23_9FUNG|nr:uncharacterized protein O0I10_011432 [Lichtheimia ornata]KAJ8652898.1 hypothetical protein O0I10_011432 [Lichtheimia ornata]